MLPSTIGMHSGGNSCRMRPPRSSTSARTRSRWRIAPVGRSCSTIRLRGCAATCMSARSTHPSGSCQSRGSALHSTMVACWPARCATTGRDSRRWSRLPPWPYGRKKRRGWTSGRSPPACGRIPTSRPQAASARTAANGSRCDCRSSGPRHAPAPRARDVPAGPSFSPITKNVDLTPRRASTSSADGVTSGVGPLSNESVRSNTAVIIPVSVKDVTGLWSCRRPTPQRLLAVADHLGADRRAADRAGRVALDGGESTGSRAGRRSRAATFVVRRAAGGATARTSRPRRSTRARACTNMAAAPGRSSTALVYFSQFRRRAAVPAGRGGAPSR